MKPDYALLGLLARKPVSGYDIGKWLRKDGRFLGRKPAMSPIYRALARLESMGFVEARAGLRDSGPEAKVYHLTGEGRRALQEWAASPYVPTERPMAPDFSARLQFAGQLGPRYALEIVRTELDFRRRQRAAEEPVLSTQDASPIPEIDVEWLQYIDAKAHDRGWMLTSWFIGWLETTERELARLAEKAERQGRTPEEDSA